MSDFTVETYERNGLEIELYTDGDAENPLYWATPEEREGNVHFALYHKRYDLPYEVEYEMENVNSWTDLAKAVTDPNSGQLPNYNYKFVRWYEHSGIAVSLRDDEGGADWDAGIAGVIFGETTDDIEAAFEPWSAYVSGEVYGYAITNPRNGELVDSCCGFYSYDEVKQTADGEADGFKWPHEAAYAKNANIIHGGK